MTHFLKNVLQRHQLGANVVQPRMKAMFESHSDGPILSEDINQDHLTSSQPDSNNNDISNRIISDENQTQKILEKPDPLFPEPATPTKISFDEIHSNEPPKQSIKEAKITATDPIGFPGQSEHPKAKKSILKKESESPTEGNIGTKNQRPNNEIQEEKRTVEILYGLRKKESRDIELPGADHNGGVSGSHPFRSLPNLKSASENGQSLPSIKVHIGKIEIKAVKESGIKKSKPGRPSPKIKSLDQILQERNHQ